MSMKYYHPKADSYWNFAPCLVVILALMLNACVWENSEISPSDLPLDDSEYPYVGIPRIVIETENFRSIRDTETKIPAKLQIYGDTSPESDVMDLSIRGRGFSSFIGMPKYSIKLKFDNKQSLLGMAKDREWALIANSADRTLLKNYITYKLSNWLGMDYAPQSQFVEVILNRKYMGVFLLVETIKVSPSRVNICESESCFLFEKSKRPKTSDVVVTTDKGLEFFVKSKNKIQTSSLKVLKQHLDSLEMKFSQNKLDDIEKWIDIDSFIKFYWIQELSKNLDGNFDKSIFLTWEWGEPIHFGPIWDFDLAYGGTSENNVHSPEGWYIRKSPWNRELLSKKEIQQQSKNFWKENLQLFTSLPDSIKKYSREIAPVTRNEFRRWPVLENTENWTYRESYKSYDEAIDSLNSWINQRIQWIDKNL